MSTFRAVVNTYNRPALLLHLLQDLKREGFTDVQVWDDASSEDCSEPKAFCAENNWEWFTAEENHGKRRFWKWMSQVFEAQQRGAQPDFWVMLQDDVRLCQNFQSQVETFWGAAPEDIGSLNLLRDVARLKSTSWTGARPSKVNARIEHVGYTDCLYVAKRYYFERLGWRVPEVSPRRWAVNPEFSSGVGMGVSKALHRWKIGQYRVMQSLIVHVESPSLMNPVSRTRDDMSAVAFVDGEDAAAKLAITEPITASMASIPTRAAELHRVVASLEGQVDQLNVFLNGYTHVPECLKQPWITIARSQDHQDLSDANKAFWTDSVEGYHFLCDDDLVYPPDYTSRLIKEIELRDRQAVVGVHGRVLKTPIVSYYKSKKAGYHCLRAVAGDHPVHVLGTGALAYHTSTIDVGYEQFPEPDMADIWFAILAQQQQVPLVVVGHAKGWLKLVKENQTDTIFDRAFRNHSRQTAVCKAISWALLPDPAPVKIGRQERTAVAALPAQRFWDKKARSRRGLASAHDGWGKDTWKAERVRLWKFLQQHWNLRSGLVLDFGCGNGRFSRNILKRSGKYIGVDFSPWMLQGAVDRHPGLQFKESLLEKIPLPDNSVPGVFACQVLEHVADGSFDAVCQELRRVAKPRARLMVFVCTHRSSTRMDWERLLVYRTALEYQTAFPGLSSRASFEIEGEQYTLLTGSML